MAELRLALEPALPPSVGFKDVESVRGIITNHLDAGDFYYPALLVERMLWNPRLRAAIGTRLNGLIATQIRWQPIRNNRDARRAANELREDWRWMAPSPQRRRFMMWGLLLGVSFAQRVPMESPTSGRRLFRLRTYWPGWMCWNDQAQKYRAETRNAGQQDVISPAYSLRRTFASESPWIVHEPFGEQSWRDAFMHALWTSWLGHEQGFQNLLRACEKFGLGIVKILYPKPGNDEEKKAIKAFAEKLRRMGREGHVPLEQRNTPGAAGGPSFDIQPFEFSNGSGFEVINNAINTAAIAMAILLLGHNLTTEVKGGSYAAAGIGEFIRSDIKAGDGQDEAATLHPQLAQPWALENYDDPEIAPEAEYVTDPPAVNQAMAQTYQQLALAIRELKAQVPEVDVVALAERFQLPLRVIGKRQVQAPEVEPVQADAPTQTTAAPASTEAQPLSTPAQETGGAEQTNAAAAATLALTATDLAAIVKVDEGRKSVGLEPVGGPVGGLWVLEHTAQLKADIPVSPDVAPGEPPPPESSDVEKQPDEPESEGA